MNDHSYSGYSDAMYSDSGRYTIMCGSPSIGASAPSSGTGVDLSPDVVSI
jgi:hypothetical protein